MSITPESYNLEELLAGYVLGDLDEEELLWLRQQLEANPQLTKQVRSLQATLALMPYELSSQMPNDRLRNQILAKAQSSFPQTELDDRGNMKLNRLGWIVGAIAVFVALGFGIDSYRLRHQLARTQFNPNRELISLLRQPNNRLMTLKSLDDPTASGSLFIVPQQNKAVLVVQNLNSLDNNNVYRLWAVSPKKKVGCASFVPNQNGMVYLEFSQENLEDANSVLITVEPESDTRQPTGSLIMKGFQSL
ncbi:MAG: anti-sigma factor [Cyanobacteriota bacterium]|nr:anti-sigma factor [Cyanobacteriota bacterium]